MLTFNKLSLRRGARELLHEVTCTIHSGQRVGVTGANGVGKSSLFAMIKNELQPDSGDFFMPPNMVIAHVEQETRAVDKAALEYVMDGDTELRHIEQQIHRAEKKNDGEKLAHWYSELETIHGYSAASRAGKLMQGLGFSSEQEQTSVLEFSGGWRMRLNLAQALMCRSDLLLLDEPTNHLDLEAVIWLEDWLLVYTGTLLLISHDRDFLDRVVTLVAHIEQFGLTLYTGNYSKFEIRRAEYLASQQSTYIKQQREIAHIKSFVDRFRAKATKARQAQSRIKALERMEIIGPAHVDSPFHFRFRPPDKLPSPLLHLEQVSAGYGQKAILNNINMNISGGDRIGLLGYNGAGKSTLIKLLAGYIDSQQGVFTKAKDINIGYFAQHQVEQLDENASPLLHLQRIAPNALEKDLRNYLGGFAFKNEMAANCVAEFSGGEKARLVLAMIVYKKPNLLLLDEPTNHLDIEMRHALSIALQEFSGAMIIVSHDRFLLRSVTDTFLLVSDGMVKPYDGDLDDYRKWVKELGGGGYASNIGDGKLHESQTTQNQTWNKQQLRQHTAKSRLKLQPLRKKIKALEKKMDNLAKEKNLILQQMDDSDLYKKDNKQQLMELIEKQKQVNQLLEDIEGQWLKGIEDLEGAITNRGN